MQKIIFLKLKNKNNLEVIVKCFSSFPFPQRPGFSIKAGGQQNSPAISHERAAYFSLEINPTRPKFNDACVLFKHSNFCSRISCPRTPPITCAFSACKSHLVWGFSFSAYSKAFATYLKPYWKPWKTHHIMLELTHYLREYIIDISP